PDFPQPRRSSPLAKRHVVHRYSMIEPNTVFFQRRTVVVLSAGVTVRCARRAVFPAGVVVDCGGTHTAALACFVAVSDCGSRVALRFAAPSQPESSVRVARTR